MNPIDPGRRQFIRTAAQSSAGFLLLPMTATLTGCKVTDTPVPGAFLSAEQRKAAGILADLILPSDSREPGASDLGIVDYLEQLLTAFDHDPPRIYAVTGESGDFIPLNRYQEAAWRMTLYGAPASPATDGKPVVGLRQLIPQGLDQAIRIAPPGYQILPEIAKNALLQLLDHDFWQTFSDLVIESSFAAPAYGGNKNQGGWKISRFDGGIVGYSQYDSVTGVYHELTGEPVSTPNPGPSTDPLTIGTLLELDVISVFTGGRVYATKPGQS